MNQNTLVSVLFCIEWSFPEKQVSEKLTDLLNKILTLWGLLNLTFWTTLLKKNCRGKLSEAGKWKNIPWPLENGLYWYLLLFMSGLFLNEPVKIIYSTCLGSFDWMLSSLFIWTWLSCSVLCWIIPAWPMWTHYLDGKFCFHISVMIMPFSLQELKNLRPQLYSAAEYCEKSYLHSEQKQM